MRKFEKAWTARETEHQDRERLYEIDYSSSTFAQLTARFPDLNVQGNFEIGRDITLKLELHSLKTVELILPVKEQDARSGGYDYEGDFIDSLLLADIIALRVTDNVRGELGAEANIIKKLTINPKVKWDDKLHAIKLAENAIIGYTLKTPTKNDIERPLKK